jgi:hypothetical protein
LQRRVKDRSAPARVAERARIVLLSAEGKTGPQIAAAGCTEPTVVNRHGTPSLFATLNIATGQVTDTELHSARSNARRL